MDILVCVKNVPEVAEADLEVISDGTAIDTDDLVFAINEWDNFAVEEAVSLKEAHGGSVTVITLGDDEAEDALRRALAMGADEAIHLCDELWDGADSTGVAGAIAAAVKDKNFDLVLTGVQAADGGQAQTGVLLAHLLGLPHVTMAIGLEMGDGKLIATRELEANTQEKVEINLPALVTVQSGLNQPRYVSIMGIRKVRKKPVNLCEASELGLSEAETGAAASAVAWRKLSLPPVGEGAEFLNGPLEDVCQQAADIIAEKGGLK
jgi:electron transfer flavoprotein beta subunit